MANCICILCVGGHGCTCVQERRKGVHRISCVECFPHLRLDIPELGIIPRPATVEDLAELLRSLDEELPTPEVDFVEEDDWRQRVGYECYTCKDTGHCPNCEETWEYED